MNTAFTLCCLLLEHFFLQTLTLRRGNSMPAVCLMAYSKEHESIIYEGIVLNNCSDIILVGLPPETKNQTPVRIMFAEGSYTFHKAAGLMVPAGYRAYIKDRHTGQHFELNTADFYSFKVHRAISSRFVLNIEKISSVSKKLPQAGINFSKRPDS